MRSFASNANALAGSDGSSDPAASVTVSLVYGGSTYRFVTSTHTVAEFLVEAGIDSDTHDFVSPAANAPLADGMRVEYREAVPVTLADGGRVQPIRSAALTIRELLAEQRISLGSHDRISPKLSAAVTPEGVVQITRVTSWVARVRQTIAPRIEHKLDFSLSGTRERVLDKGSAGVREITYRFDQRDARARISRTLLATRVVREPRAKIVAHGVGSSLAFAGMAERGFERTLALAGNALQMIATAYTASCSGCSGIAAIGIPAGHGIVAVDPRVIPLGSKLYIPGYGHALAGDTGGAIVGSRIDLGFNSTSEAVAFGHRPVTVYVLR